MPEETKAVTLSSMTDDLSAQLSGTLGESVSALSKLTTDTTETIGVVVKTATDIAGNATNDAVKVMAGVSDATGKITGDMLETARTLVGVASSILDGMSKMLSSQASK